MNGYETEAKFYIQDLRKMELRLQELKAQLIQPRTHETNLRFDNANSDLRNTYRVLRLRQDEKARLTFKGPSTEKAGGILSRREIEFVVEDFESARHFLEALEFEAVVFYEKYRTVYELEDVQIMLDELPYGEFIEIEGENADSIHAAANLLGLNWNAMIKAGYHALFERVAGKFNLDVSQLSFAALEKVNITSDDLSIESADYQID
jgi:adenylate cyclase class 2